MRKMMCLLAMSVLALGCVPEAKTPMTANSLGVSANAIGCTWEPSGWSPLPQCGRYY